MFILICLVGWYFVELSKWWESGKKLDWPPADLLLANKSTIGTSLQGTDKMRELRIFKFQQELFPSQCVKRNWRQLPYFHSAHCTLISLGSLVSQFSIVLLCQQIIPKKGLAGSSPFTKSGSSGSSLDTKSGSGRRDFPEAGLAGLLIKLLLLIKCRRRPLCSKVESHRAAA